MNELSNLVAERMQACFDEGKVEEIIEKQLTSMVKSLLEDSFRSYGDFGKAVREKLDKSLASSLDRVTFPEYQEFISKSLLSLVSQQLSTSATDAIDNGIKELFSPLPKSINHEEFAKMVMDELDEYDTESDGYGNRRPEKLYINEDDNRFTISVNNTDITLYDHGSPGIYTISYINTDRGKQPTKSIPDATYTYGLEGVFYRLYCSQVKITGLDRLTEEDFVKDDEECHC